MIISNINGSYMLIVKIANTATYKHKRCCDRPGTGIW